MSSYVSFSLYIQFCEASIQTFFQFLFGMFVSLLLSFKCLLYILNLCPLSDKIFKNISYHL